MELSAARYACGHGDGMDGKANACTEYVSCRNTSTHLSVRGQWPVGGGSSRVLGSAALISSKRRNCVDGNVTVGRNEFVDAQDLLMQACK